MNHLEQIVDQVIEAFDARRRTKWSATTLPLTGDHKELESWRPVIEQKLNAFRHSKVDRSRLIERMQKHYPGGKRLITFEEVANELQELSRDDLEHFLSDNGMPKEVAHRVAQGYSIGALLHDS